MNATTAAAACASEPETTTDKSAIDASIRGLVNSVADAIAKEDAASIAADGLPIDSPDRKEVAFDKTAEAERNVLPIIDRLYEECAKLGLPMVVRVVCRRSLDEDGEGEESGTGANYVGHFGPSTNISIAAALGRPDVSPATIAMAVMGVAP